VIECGVSAEVVFGNVALVIGKLIDHDAGSDGTKAAG
jgi:hypothetical protein